MYGKHLINRPAIVVIAILTFFSICPPFSFTDEPLIIQDVKDAIKHSGGYLVDVSLIPNKETKKGDLYIKPAQSHNYKTDTFIMDIAESIGKLTAESIAYRIYLGIIMVDVNNKLFAISSENCRAIFNAKDTSQKKSILQKNLKRLR